MMDTQEKQLDQDTYATRRAAFLAAHGMAGRDVMPLPADASFRRYFRLTQDGQAPLLLMQDPTDLDPALSVSKTRDFVRVARHLVHCGLRAPIVYAEDHDNGFLLIEDFGTDTFTRLLDAGEKPAPLYENAVDGLLRLHRHPDGWVNGLGDDETVIDFMVRRVGLYLEWYYRREKGVEASATMKTDFADLWRAALTAIPSEQRMATLYDVHVDNLIRIPNETGVKSCGWIDFQDAFRGFYAYDLVSLLQDARRSMAPDLYARLYDRYLNGMAGQAGFDPDVFEHSYALLAVKRHARVLGVFARLTMRDNKTQYLRYIPHTAGLLAQALRALPPCDLTRWFEKYGV